MGQRELRDVRFSLPAPGPEIELTGLRDIIRRGGPREFLSTQRLGFELLYLVESGSTVHQVDFVPHELGPGNALWVRTGQVHRWGDISDLTGRVALFPPHAIPPEVQQALAELGYAGSVGRAAVWTAGQLDAAGATQAWQALHADDSGVGSPVVRSRLREAALSAVLLRLASASPGVSGTTAGEGGDRSRVFSWFTAEVEARFRAQHLVSDYARRLGWSSKTLGRAAAEHGTTPKQVIDDRIVLEAKRLLVHTTRSVAEIADDLGFDDPSNFSTFFRHRTSEPPGVFRAEASRSQPHDRL